jgi:hypothetical protein
MAVLVGIAAPVVTLAKALREGNAFSSFLFRRSSFGLLGVQIKSPVIPLFQRGIARMQFGGKNRRDPSDFFLAL